MATARIVLMAMVVPIMMMIMVMTGMMRVFVQRSGTEQRPGPCRQHGCPDSDDDQPGYGSEPGKELLGEDIAGGQEGDEPRANTPMVCVAVTVSPR